MGTKFTQLAYSRGQVRKAGETLRAADPWHPDLPQAMLVINNWRAAHAYPLNTFQATLRNKLAILGLGSDTTLVGQRLKRLTSIEKKLRRNEGMKLERMQDIAGLRAVVPTTSDLQRLRELYEIHSRFKHQLKPISDYVAEPKDDGYRSIHLIYRYMSSTVPTFDGLHLELQMRTSLQHAWATAVETVDIFANQAIKAGNPNAEWAWFFQLASAAFAGIEKCPVPAQFRSWTRQAIHDELRVAERNLNVLVRMRGFSVAADRIHQDVHMKGEYHLVVLDTERRMLSIRSFSKQGLEQATDAYAEAERRTSQGHPIDAVLVAGNNVTQLRRTYPNYFLDATTFLERLELICKTRK